MRYDTCTIVYAVSRKRSAFAFTLFRAGSASGSSAARFQARRRATAVMTAAHATQDVDLAGSGTRRGAHPGGRWCRRPRRCRRRQSLLLYAREASSGDRLKIEAGERGYVQARCVHIAPEDFGLVLHRGRVHRTDLRQCVSVRWARNNSEVLTPAVRRLKTKNVAYGSATS